jgi:hypothetical protein
MSPDATTADLARALVMYGVYPLWVAAGLFDWACHRRTRIEETGGVTENLLHWLLYALAGAGVLVVAAFETTGGALLVVLGLFVSHELLVWIELRYVVPRRHIAPVEQMVHSVQEIVPLAGLALLCVVAGDRLFELGLSPRSQPAALGWWAGAVAATLAFNLLPLAEEAWRCLRFRRRTRSRPAPR